MATVEINKEFVITIILVGIIIALLRPLDKEIVLLILTFPLFKGIYNFLIWFPLFLKYS